MYFNKSPTLEAKWYVIVPKVRGMRNFTAHTENMHEVYFNKNWENRET